MFGLGVKLAALERLSLCVCLLSAFGTIHGLENGTAVVTVTEGSDAVLPCSLGTKENIENMHFEWERGDFIFSYDKGTHSINDPRFRSLQDYEFKGRVSHFQEELKNGDASILIRETRPADSGDYTCDFPNLNPRQTFYIKLVVVDAVTVSVKEGDYIELPCSLGTKENIEAKTFVWWKDGQRGAGRKDVFMYDRGLQYGKGLSGQDPQFKGRVEHSTNFLEYGDASIDITGATLADSGDYTCDFPCLQPPQKFKIKLVVTAEKTLRDRSGETPGAAPKPYITTLESTEDGALLQCVVGGAFPKPLVQWQDSEGNIIPAGEPEVTEKGHYRYYYFYITLNVTVTKTDRYQCLATQEEIYHQISTETFVPFYVCEDSSRRVAIGWSVGFLLGALAAALLALVATKCISRNKGV